VNWCPEPASRVHNVWTRPLTPITLHSSTRAPFTPRARSTLTPPFPALAPQARSTADKDDKYRQWLERLRSLCTSCGVPLLFDEVYTGFRMAVGGAQQYYGIQVGA
jgi:hypothetical protein